MGLNPAERIDGLIGDGLERTIRARHRRRLAKAGRAEQFDPPQDGALWAAGDPAPRDGSALEVLIDGAQALPRIAELLEGARSSVHIAGWHVTPHFGLTRHHETRALRDLLGDLAERIDVRVLLWAGAPVPVFTPSRAEVRAVRDELLRGTKVQVELDAHERPMHCHHEKLVLVDGEVATVGGIDLTSLTHDRFDASDHGVRGHTGWHDVATQLRGPAVADVAAHFAARWEANTGDTLEPVAPPAAGGDHTVQIVRTVPEKIYDFEPHGDFRILESYVRALRSAERFVYLESQFLWSADVVRILADKLRTPPSDDFRVVVLLPADPANGADTTRGQLGVLAEADAGTDRFLATTISQLSGQLHGPLYVHAKVGIVDDTWLTVGSANLNEHSFFNDTEVNVVSCDPALVRETRLRLWAEHLERSVDDVSGDPVRVIDDLWWPIAREQAERHDRGAPRTHRLSALPGVSRRSAGLLGPLDSLMVDG
ncbi:MAG: phospholipase D family protein [Patulibacter sp.]|nr:phospholipase D family protein [Patulibacter sp.]